MKIFVFPSNLKGIHGAGAALHARQNYGAELGIGDGPTGRSYAIPTKAKPTHERRQFSLTFIQERIKNFLVHAKNHPDDTFLVARIGCGLAGYENWEIAPMFAGAPENCEFDPIWAIGFSMRPWKEQP